MKTQPARFVSRVFVVCAVSVGSVAGAQSLLTGSDRATAQVEALEQQLKVEFLAAGNATRERLDQEAAGNHVGVQRAARVAEAHRHRFLDLKRDIARLTTPIAPSVAAARDPFEPDPSFVAFAAHAGENRALTIAAAEEGESSSGPTPRPAWDLYRPRTASRPSVATRGDRADSTPLLVKTQGDAERAWGMYEHAAPSRGTGETRFNFEHTSASSAAPEAREPPSHPYFVYRDPQGPPTSR